MNELKLHIDLRTHRALLVQRSKLKRFSTSQPGFKKLLFNVVLVRDSTFVPAYNRRKHSHSHSLIIYNQLRNLSKVFGYLSQNKIRFCVAQSLKLAYTKSRLWNDHIKVQATDQHYLQKRLLNSEMLTNKTSMAFITHIIETQSFVLISKNQFSVSFMHAAQSLVHQQKATNKLEKVLSLTKENNGAWDSMVAQCWVGPADVIRLA